MKFLILLSTVTFAVLTFMINREKLVKKYKMVMVKNRGLSIYVNATLKKISSLCEKYDSCDKYLRGKNDTTPKEKVESVPVQKVIPLPEFSWRDCKKFRKSNLNRTEALYQQLKKVVKVFNKPDYIIGYGPLLGIIRDNQMNVNEVDNDIIVGKNFNPTPYKEALFNKGLIIFKFGMYRICEYSPVKGVNKPPWSAGNYVTYTDIYKQLPHVLVDPEKSSTIVRKKVNIVQRKFRDIYVNVPDDELINTWFSKRYGNWRVPLITGWKKNVKNTFK